MFGPGENTRFWKRMGYERPVSATSTSTAANSSYRPPRIVQRVGHDGDAGNPSRLAGQDDDVASVVSFTESEAPVLNEEWLAQQDSTKGVMTSGEKCNAFVSEQPLTAASAGELQTISSPASATAVSTQIVPYTPSPTISSPASSKVPVKTGLRLGAKRSLNFANLDKKNDKSNQETSKCGNDYDKENNSEHIKRNKNNSQQKVDVAITINPTAPVARSYLSPYQTARLKNIEENNKALQELLVSTPGTSEEHSRGFTTKSTKTASSQKTNKGRESQSTPKSGTASNQKTSKGSTSGSTEKSGTVSKSSRSLRPLSSSKQPKYTNFFQADDFEDDILSDSGDDDCSAKGHSGKNNDSSKSDEDSDRESSRGTNGSDHDTDTVSEQGSDHQPGNGHLLENGISSDDEDQPDNTTPITQKSAQVQRKLLRNSGQEYVTPKGKVIPDKRTPKEPIHTGCVNDCSEKISEHDAKVICSEYWKQSSYEKRKLYVSSRVEAIPKQRSRPRKGTGIVKNKTCKYFLMINKKKERVCRGTFLNVLGETDAFVRRIVENMTTSGTVQNDKRGKHKPKRKLTEEKNKAVLDHIATYPKYVSHYCRKQSSQLYLPSHLNVEIMHRDYKEKVNQPVSYWSYRRIFKSLKLKFKQPNKDTCAKCDTWDMKIKLTLNEEEKGKLEKEKELHLRKAEGGYTLKRISRQTFAADASKRVLVFDLEQCLPTPLLKCSEVYYKRQLYVFNLTIYDCSSKLTYCYMWHEGEGARGANEIASCIFRHCMDNIPEEVRHIRLFSDSCTGQNKNSIVAAMFLTLLQEKPSLQTIDHIFLVPGHTRLECDNKHSVIERAKKTVESLQVPSEWYSLVDIAGKTDIDKYPEGRFRVVEMKKKFYNFAALLEKTGPLVKRMNNETGGRFYYLDTFWFKYSRNNQFKVLVKSSFSEDAHFSPVNFLRRKKDLKSGLQLKNVLPKLPATSVITVKKKEDLLKLLKYVSTEHHDFYKQLLTSDEITEDYDPDLPSDNSEESDTDE